MHVLAIEPYFGGSHEAFLNALTTRSVHRWTLATLPARHWKWRMRSAPAAINDALFKSLDGDSPDLVLASDMLDLPTWLGLSCRDTRLASWLPQVPLVTYFHENQWAYPQAPDARVDHHYGFTNLLTAAASDACWFNSRFNRDSFLQHSESFLRRMPDRAKGIDLDRILTASKIIAPGFEPPPFETTTSCKFGSKDSPRPCLGWVARFEHDKRPDRFAELIERLMQTDREFDLIVLGGRDAPPEPLAGVLDGLGTRVRFRGFAESRAEYEHWLSQMDLIVSTADHEFFGMAVCEAIWAGAIPIVPDGLSYQEYVPNELRYRSLDQAVALILDVIANPSRGELSAQCRRAIADYRSEHIATVIDEEIRSLC